MAEFICPQCGHIEVIHDKPAWRDGPPPVCHVGPVWVESALGGVDVEWMHGEREKPLPEVARWCPIDPPADPEQAT